MAEKQSQAEKRKKFLKRHGLSRFNKAVRTTEGGKKGKVAIIENIAKGPTSAAYWANKVLWSGSGGSKKSPPKSQKHVKGRKS